SNPAPPPVAADLTPCDQGACPQVVHIREAIRSGRPGPNPIAAGEPYAPPETHRRPAIPLPIRKRRGGKAGGHRGGYASRCYRIVMAMVTIPAYNFKQAEPDFTQ